MPAKKPEKMLVPCPHCGRRQYESKAAISTFCKHCGQHYVVQEALRPARHGKPGRRGPIRRLTCFDCGTQLEVSPQAQSTMCKRCSAHIDLQDYRISNAVSKNFKTKGRFAIESRGYVFNTEAVVGEAIIKGRFLGKLYAETSLTIYSSAEIKGTFRTPRIIIPAANHFFWPDTILVSAAEIAGELAANLRVDGTVLMRATARFFGDVAARNLVVEDGAVLVGRTIVGPLPG